MRQITRYTPANLRASLAPGLELLTGVALAHLDAAATFPRQLSLLVGPPIEHLTGGRFEHCDDGLVRIRLDAGNRDGVVYNLAHELGHLLIDAATQPLAYRSTGWLLLNEYAAERIGYQLIQEAGLLELDPTADKLERELIEIQFLWRVSVSYAQKIAHVSQAANQHKACDRFLTHFVYMCAAIDALPIAHEESIWTRDLPDSVAHAMMAFIAPADELYAATLVPSELRGYMGKASAILNRSLSALMKPHNFSALVTRPGSVPTRVLQFSRPVGELFETSA